VTVALDSLERGLGSWSGSPASERREILERAAESLPLPSADSRRAALLLGLGAGEFEQHLGGLERSAREGLAEGLQREGAAGGVLTCLRRSWAEPLSAAARVLWRELAQGCGVLLVGDRRAPALADHLAGALTAAGLPAGALALLHDDGDDVLRAAAESGRVGRMALSGWESEGALWSERVRRWGRMAAFGAGVVEAAQGPRFVFDPLARSVVEVGLGEDPAAAAERVVRGAFDRVHTISGQLAGQVGVVQVEPRRLSAFTAALLAALEERRLVDPPLPPVDPHLGRELAARRDLGLDEGATLLHEFLVGSSGSGAGARILRLVFTNVEPGMRLLDATRPAPVLLLCRRPIANPPGGPG